MAIWLSIALVSSGSFLLVWNLITFWRLRRLFRHALALDTLLQRLCVEAFARQHQPIWKAWTAVMGNICIEVQQTRTMPGDEG